MCALEIKLLCKSIFGSKFGWLHYLHFSIYQANISILDYLQSFRVVIFDWLNEMTSEFPIYAACFKGMHIFFLNVKTD